MKCWSVFALVMAIAASAGAAPNVTNVTQKGSLLIFPDIRVDDNWNTLVRIENDGGLDVDLICYWMDGNKNRLDFIVPVTRNQPIWFDARTGNGTSQVNPFPNTASNGIDNPTLAGPWAGGFVDPATTNEDNDSADPYERGLLACWVVDAGAENQVKWNHLSGTATIYHPDAGAYEYNAYAFFVPSGLDLQPVGTAGRLELNGTQYDACPLYQIGQFTPVGAPGPISVTGLRLAVASCTLNLRQDWIPVFTMLTFDVWNEEEVKFTGAVECADSWHETEFEEVLDATNGGPFDAGGQNFLYSTLGTFAARYRLQTAKIDQCPDTVQVVPVIAVQSMAVDLAGGVHVGTTLTNAGKFSARIRWDPEGSVPEGGIR